MKRNLLLAIILLPVFSFGQTKIKNKQEVFGTWDKSGSPYIVEGEAIVPKGKTLTIKPGVIVQFKTGEDRYDRLESELNPNFNVGFLRVQGNIIAKGKKKKQIQFTSYGMGNWGNIFLEESKNNVFKYCVISNSFYMRLVTETDNATGALSFYDSNGIVEFCTLAYNGWTAINCKLASSPSLKNLTIVGNNYGIECNTASCPEIENVIMWDNKTAFYLNNNSKPTIKNSCLQDDEFPYEAEDKGGNLTGKDPKFENAQENDFSLRKSSPCAKNNMGANP